MLQDKLCFHIVNMGNFLLMITMILGESKETETLFGCQKKLQC